MPTHIAQPKKPVVVSKPKIPVRIKRIPTKTTAEDKCFESVSPKSELQIPQDESSSPGKSPRSYAESSSPLILNEELSTMRKPSIVVSQTQFGNIIPSSESLSSMIPLEEKTPTEKKPQKLEPITPKKDDKYSDQRTTVLPHTAHLSVRR